MSDSRNSLGRRNKRYNTYNNGARGWDLVGQVTIGLGVGAVIGAGVGLVAEFGGAYLASGLASVGGKFVEDIFAYSMYGTSIGTWEDYSIAFIYGGATAGKGWMVKAPLDILVRPFLAQTVKIGTGRQDDGYQWDKMKYDMATRALTFGLSSPWRSFARGITRGYWDVWKNGYPVGQYYMA